MENKRWLIGIDLDGTTLMSNNITKEERIQKAEEIGHRYDVVHPDAKEAFKKIQDAGHIIVIDTGRNWEEAKHIYEELGLRGPIINNAGANIHHPHDEDFEETLIGMPEEDMKRLLTDDMITPHLRGYTLDKKNTMHLNINGSEIIQYIWDTKPEPKVLFDGNLNWDPQCSIIDLDLDYDELLPLIEKLKPNYPMINFARWGHKGRPFYGVEMNPSVSNKGTALMQLAEYYDIDQANTMGIGDADNDIDLIKLAGVGVAMKNSNETILGLADEVTEFDNDENGVAKFLLKFFNI